MAVPTACLKRKTTCFLSPRQTQLAQGIAFWLGLFISWISWVFTALLIQKRLKVVTYASAVGALTTIKPGQLLLNLPLLRSKLFYTKVSSAIRVGSPLGSWLGYTAGTGVRDWMCPAGTGVRPTGCARPAGTGVRPTGCARTAGTGVRPTGCARTGDWCKTHWMCPYCWDWCKTHWMCPACWDWCRPTGCARTAGTG